MSDVFYSFLVVCIFVITSTFLIMNVCLLLMVISKQSYIRHDYVIFLVLLFQIDFVTILFLLVLYISCTNTLFHHLLFHDKEYCIRGQININELF